VVYGIELAGLMSDYVASDDDHVDLVILGKHLSFKLREHLFEAFKR